MRRNKRRLSVIPPSHPDARDEGPRLIPLDHPAAGDRNSRVGYHVQLANQALGLPSDSYSQHRTEAQEMGLRSQSLLRSTAKKLRASTGGVNQASIDFLEVDLEIARTYVQMAKATRDCEHQGQLLQHARAAYDMVNKWIWRVELSPDAAIDLFRDLELVRSDLISFGKVS